MALLVFAHVDANEVVFVVEEIFGEGARQFGFADAGGAEEDEAADGAVGVLEAGAAAANGGGDGGDSLFLADHAFVQFFVHAHEPFALTLHQLVDGDAGPFADDGGDLIVVDLFLEECTAGLDGGDILAGGVKLPLQLVHAPVAELGGPLQVIVAFGVLDIGAQLLAFLFQGAQGLDGGPFGLPADGEL